MSYSFIFPRYHVGLSTLQETVARTLLPRTFDLYSNLDWSQEVASFAHPNFCYPSYYTVPHHGMRNGYLSYKQAAGWEAVERIFRITHVRPTIVKLMQSLHPHSIVDLGCGTALTSIELLRCEGEPRALSLVDLSPYALVAAERQVRAAGFCGQATYLHRMAEHTGLPSNQTDLVVISLLLHELPYQNALQVLHEAYRLLRPGGSVLIFDPIQNALPWPFWNQLVNRVLGRVMHEVYWMDYATHPAWTTCEAAGFHHIEHRLLPALPWIYQVVMAKKK